LNNEEQLKTNASEFVLEAKAHIERVGTANSFNSDQSGFNFELAYGRTLTTQGVKSVKVVAQSVNALTHSYTVQPTVNADGKFLKPMLLVLPETSGSFGPIVAKTMFKVRLCSSYIATGINF